MKKINMLTGHVGLDTAYLVDYDNSDKRVKKKKVWIESHPLMGDRMATMTFHPKTNKPNKIQYTSYASLIYLFKDAKGQLRSKRYFFKDEAAVSHKRQFQKLVAEIDSSKLADTQRFNIRIDMMTSFKADSYRELGLRKGPVVEHFTQWRNDVLYFLHKCPFDLLGNYPELPPYRNPNASSSPEGLE
jgi:hypothetical protein